MKTSAVCFAALCVMSAFISVTSFSQFSDDFAVTWGQQNVKFDGSEVQLGLDNKTGSGFGSKFPFLFGYIAMKIKLVPGNSAGTVTSYYLSSIYNNHGELDFEFLGNVTGQPYILQTNVFVEGVGNREQRIYLWFDPTADFHTYGLLWNQDLILFFVDDKAIRVYQNLRDSRAPYLDYQEMYSYSSLWDASGWATRGGRDRIDYSLAPFEATYTDFDIEACRVTNSSETAKNFCYRELYIQPYGSQANRTLTNRQWEDLKWVQSNYLIYDYCADPSRWTTQPYECLKNWPGHTDS